MPNVKEKENLKAVRENQLPTWNFTDDLSTKKLVGQKELAQNIHSNEKQGPTIKITLPSKAII